MASALRTPGRRPAARRSFPFASPSTAYIYDWNLLPIGQMLWEKELMSYVDFPPLQLAASYNLEQVLQQVREMGAKHPSE
jgi:arylsulfatase